jgi:hypothetical protein
MLVARHGGRLRVVRARGPPAATGVPGSRAFDRGGRRSSPGGGRRAVSRPLERRAVPPGPAEGELAHDLRPHVQGRVGVSPGVERQGRPFGARGHASQYILASFADLLLQPSRGRRPRASTPIEVPGPDGSRAPAPSPAPRGVGPRGRPLAGGPRRARRGRPRGRRPREATGPSPPPGGREARRDGQRPPAPSP